MNVSFLYIYYPEGIQKNQTTAKSKFVPQCLKYFNPSGRGSMSKFISQYLPVLKTDGRLIFVHLSIQNHCLK